MKKILVALTLLNSGLVMAQQSGTNPSISPSPTDTLAPTTVISTAPAPPVQTSAKAPADKNELKYNLNESGSHFFKVTFLNQTWLRLNQSNPGTTVIQEPKSNTFDIGLRRTRIQMFGQISDHVFLYF